MTLAVERPVLPAQPAMWVCEFSGVEMRKIEVPFTGVKGSWEQNLLAAAPRTHKDNPVLTYGKYFNKPAAPAAKTFTLLLGDNYCWMMRSAKGATEFAESRPIWPASPYHVFEAIKHVGGINRQSWWDSSFGPGVIIPKKVKYKPEIICLWYRNFHDVGGAQVRGFGENFDHCVSAFVTYNWEARK